MNITQCALPFAFEESEARGTPPVPPEWPESKADYERRRCREMAEKLGWPSHTHGPVRSWPGFSIAEGKAAWEAFFQTSDENDMSIALIGLRDRLNPWKWGCVDEKTGLCRFPVELDCIHSEQKYARLIQLAEYLDWPHVRYWSACEVREIGPGEAFYRTAREYGSIGLIVEAVEALERRARGEPDRIAKPVYVGRYEEEEE